MNYDLLEFRPEHLQAIAALLESPAFYPINTVEAIRFRTFDDASFQPSLSLIATVEDRIVGFCLASVRGDLGVIALFGVSPEYRRQGIATALFDEVERRLATQDIATLAVEGVAPRWFFPGVELTHTPAIAFLIQRGYDTNRAARIDMRVDLARADLDSADTENALAAQGVVLTRATADQVSAAAGFAGEHFSDHWSQEVGDASRFTGPPLHIALDGDRVVAFAAYDVSGPGRFGPTGTQPDYRHRGIGSALMRACLRDIRDRGDAIAEICWVGPIGYYARVLDARIHRAYWCFRKPIA